MDANTVVVLVILLVLSSASSKSIPTFAGPYILYLIKFVECDANDTDWRDTYGSLTMSSFNPSRPFEPQNMTGSFTLRFDLDDRYPINVVVHKRNNNQWKKNYFVFSHVPMGSCSAVRANMPDLYRVLFKPKSMTGRCVIPKGTYTVDHEAIHWRFPNLPTLPYGSYFARMTCGRLETKGNSVSICGESVIIPKP